MSKPFSVKAGKFTFYDETAEDGHVFIMETGVDNVDRCPLRLTPQEMCDLADGLEMMLDTLEQREEEVAS